MYLIMLSVKQGGIKYHFLSLWYDWDWTPVSQAIGNALQLLTHNFSPWPYYGVLSSRPHLALLLLSQGLLNQRSAAPAGCPATHWHSLWLIESLLAASWDGLKTNSISLGHLHTSFHNAHDFCSTTWLLLLIYAGVSCIEKYLFDSLVKG